jgi:hypothetical protein
MMALATFAAIGAGETLQDTRDAPMEIVRSYRNSCMQALIRSHYTKPGPYTIETLIMYMEGEFLIINDDQVHLYLLIGNIVRLSLRMGLHRDATKVGGNITPFQAEMRRRVWHHIAQIDLLGSFHIGLPGMVGAIESDTLYPQNLRDEDLDESSTELPPGRPDSELTPTSYLICKSRLCHACGQIAAFANRLTLPPYSEVMKMDGLLHEAYATVPSFFQMPSEFSLFDSPDLIIRQFSLVLVFQKSRCMLHRKYIMKGNDNPQYAYSKKAALDASMELLRFQAMSYDAALPGGPLTRDRWVLSTLTMHDFLLASMIVSINIIQVAEASSNSTSGAEEVDQKMAKALEKSYDIFMDMRSVVADARKASALLRAMLNKAYRALGRPLVPEDEGSRSMNGGSKASEISGLSLDGEFHPPSWLINTIVFLSILSQKLMFPDPSQPNSLPKSDIPILGTCYAWFPANMAAPSGVEMPFNTTQAAAATDPLGAVIDIPGDVDWVCHSHIFISIARDKNSSS